MKKLLALICAAVLLLSTVGCASPRTQNAASAAPSLSLAAAQTEAPSASPQVMETESPSEAPSEEMAGEESEEAAAEAPVLTANIRGINKHGNVILDVTFDDMKAYDMEIGDIITVSMGDEVWEMPIGTSYTDVDSGCMICRFDLDDNDVILGKNASSIAEDCGIAEKKTIAEDLGYEWIIHCEYFCLSLKEKGGYAEEYAIRDLERTNERSDYPELTDEEFANFRAISVTGIKSDTLYRSSNPLDARLGRNSYAMVAMEKAGIKTVLNLVNSPGEMKAYAAWADSYYSRCSILNAGMEFSFSSDSFGKIIKNCVLFINSNDGPYLIHCKEGKDRTGILCAILECYAGASSQEILDDYMKTYQNFFHVEEGTEKYSRIADLIFEKILQSILGFEDYETADLQQSAEDYLLRSGLTEEDLLTLRQRIMNP